MKLINGLSIDVEEWFCVSNFAPAFPPESWAAQPSRIEEPTRRLLCILGEHKVRATFFVLGWVGERHPELLREIAAAGHELATHGYGHELAYSMAPGQFRADLDRSIEILRQAVGVSPLGYRAPSFSARLDQAWFWAGLAGAGLKYDSSVFPVRHARYGANPAASRFAFTVNTAHGPLVELPPATRRLAGRNIPVAGGGYLRLYPYDLTRWAIRRLNAAGHPAIVYCHPWEFDPGQPRPSGIGRLTVWRHRVGLPVMAERLRRLLGDFAFGPLREIAGV